MIDGQATRRRPAPEARRPEENPGVDIATLLRHVRRRAEDPGADLRDMTVLLADMVTAVLELHRPTEFATGGTTCQHCWSPAHLHPCLTERAMRDVVADTWRIGDPAETDPR